MSIGKRWGVQLSGHQFDLADWAEALKEPFDPWVDQSEDQFVLRWSGFDDLETADEVNRNAPYIVDLLNGAMGAARGTRPITSDAVVKFRPDGTRSRNKASRLGPG